MNEENALNLSTAAAPSPNSEASTPTSSGDAGAADKDVGDVRQERDDYLEHWRRTAAEFDNYRKRVERERRERAEGAAADLLRQLLPIVDDFERALQADEGAGDAYRRGVEIIYRQVTELLRKSGVTPVETVGAAFDPRYHQAVNAEPSSGRPDGEILEEYRRGYMLGDRLLRPAMVKVAQA